MVMGLGERSNVETRTGNRNQRSVSRKQAGGNKKKVKTRTLETHKDAAPKIVYTVSVSATRPGSSRK